MVESVGRCLESLGAVVRWSLRRGLIAAGAMCCLWCLGVFAVVARAEENTQQKLQAESEHGTIVVTKEMTGEYHPRFQPKLPEVISGIISQTNEFRKQQKLGPLQVSDVLTQTAQDFADYMAKTGRYGHEADERTPSQRATAHDYEICFIGENIAMQYKENGFATGPLMKAFFQGWKNSPPHRANMLQVAVTETGVAIAQSADTGAYFAVQLVGRPLSQAINVQIKNETAREVTYQIGSEQFPLPGSYTRRHMLCSPTKMQLLVDGQPGPEVDCEPGAEYVIRLASGTLKLEKVPVAAATGS